MINGYSIGDFSRNVGFESQRNLVSVVSNSYNNVSLSRFAYTNDAAGRRTNREDSGSAFASTQANSFGYNARNEVTSADMRNGNSTYNFDQIGNRITVSTPDEPNPLDYTTNALNQYTSVQSVGSVVSTPTHDPDGNLTNDGKGTTFEWNAENRMVRVTTPTKVIENTFDAQGRRVRKKVFDSNLQTLTSDIRYFYDGWNVIYEDDVLASADTKYYVWGLDLSQSLQGAGGVGGLLLVKQGPNTWAPTFDANGNISEYVDLSDGSVSAHLEYDAFGRKIVTTGTAPSTFGFSTKYEDVETSYLYYGFRFYDPQTGRWPNRDPIEEEDGCNLYVFVGNDGIDYIDKLGLTAKWLPEIITGKWDPDKMIESQNAIDAILEKHGSKNAEHKTPDCNKRLNRLPGQFGGWSTEYLSDGVFGIMPTTYTKKYEYKLFEQKYAESYVAKSQVRIKVKPKKDFGVTLRINAKQQFTVAGVMDVYLIVTEKYRFWRCFCDIRFTRNTQIVTGVVRDNFWNKDFLEPSADFVGRFSSGTLRYGAVSHDIEGLDLEVGSIGIGVSP